MKTPKGNYTLRVAVNQLNGRIGPGRIYPVITVAKKDALLHIIHTIEGEKLSWGAAKFGEAVAWFALKHLKGNIKLPAVYWQAWPTPYIYYPAYPKKLAINQKFGANPEHYKKFKLPGHEGIDFFIENNDPITAVMPGEVYRVEERPDVHAYGKHVRLLHQDGYKTIYAHLNEVHVVFGQAISAGAQLGLGGSTGNSTGPHLHLTMKKKGTASKYPYDIIDPTPWMEEYLRG